MPALADGVGITDVALELGRCSTVTPGLATSCSFPNSRRCMVIKTGLGADAGRSDTEDSRSVWPLSRLAIGDPGMFEQLVTI